MMNERIRRLSLAAIVLTLPSLFVAIACGGGDSSSGGGGDASFVRDVCGAFGKAQGDITKLEKDPSLQSDAKKAATELGKVLDTLAGSLSKAKPPADASTEYNQALTALKAATAKLKTGDLSAMDNFSPPAFKPDVEARLQKAAGSEKTCNGVDAFKS